MQGAANPRYSGSIRFPASRYPKTKLGADARWSARWMTHLISAGA